jgi:hypothetical protein
MWQLARQGLVTAHRSARARTVLVQRLYSQAASVRVPNCRGCGAVFQHIDTEQPGAVFCRDGSNITMCIHARYGLGYIASVTFDNKLAQLAQWHNRQGKELALAAFSPNRPLT